MTKIIYVFLGVLFLESCVHCKEPFSIALRQQIDSFIEKHPAGQIVNLTASRLRGKDLLFISNSNSYNPDMTDCYYVYKSKLVTYYQTDSIDRSFMVDLSVFSNFKDTIKGYDDCYGKISNFEYDEETYILDEIGNVTLIEDDSTIKFKDSHIDIFYNKELNDHIASFINTNIGVLYELRFVQKSNRNVVTLRSMPFYDKDKYDGYYYDNQVLIVLYNAISFRHLFKRKWKRKTKEGILMFRNSNIREWNYPYPLKLEIMKNGSIKKLTLEEGFTI